VGAVEYVTHRDSSGSRPKLGRTGIKNVINRTRKPIRISLPGGKTLYLGLAGRGQVPDDALERPALRKLIEAGEIEVIEPDSRPAAADEGPIPMRRSTQGHPGMKDTPRKGER